MYFIFSKVLLFLITPFYWVAILLIVALFCKQPKIKKRFFIFSAVIFIFFSNPFLYHVFVKCWNYPPTVLKTQDRYSCAILLGGFASEDENSNGYFNQASDRFIQALELKTTGHATHILVTSGNSSLIPDKFREGDWVKAQLVKLNMPDSCIITEDSSRNTFENASFSKKLLLARHLQPPYLLVTGAFHMRRALYIFEKNGISVVPYPSEYNWSPTSFSISQFIPDPAILGAWTYYLKEAVGIAVAYVK